MCVSLKRDKGDRYGMSLSFLNINQINLQKHFGIKPKSQPGKLCLYIFEKTTSPKEMAKSIKHFLTCNEAILCLQKLIKFRLSYVPQEFEKLQ